MSKSETRLALIKRLHQARAISRVLARETLYARLAKAAEEQEETDERYSSEAERA